MRKLGILFTVALIGLTGCATNSDIAKLQHEIDVVEANSKLTNEEIQTLKHNCNQMQSAAKEQHLKCVEHCKTIESKLDSKLDRMFKKSQLK
jgi:cell division protein FtsB